MQELNIPWRCRSYTAVVPQGLTENEICEQPKLAAEAGNERLTLTP
jgi:hypothetical protein